jgi:hypothetical protein
MAALVTLAADGKWFWYRLGPAELAVHTSSDSDRGITLSWKGEMGPGYLRHFFESVATQVSKHRKNGERAWRVWAVTEDGPQVIKNVSDDRLISSSEFVQFESLLKAPSSDEELGAPIVAVFSNQDRRADKLEEAQESVGIYLRDPSDLAYLRDEIAVMVAKTTSRFFMDSGYSREAALLSLKEASTDLKVAHLVD